MHKSVPLFLAIGSSLLLGLRHGIDWDHIAAITDIIGTTDEKKKGFFLGTVYALGHASVIIILGLAAVVVGLMLPGWVDAVMSPVVGLTLVLLSVWLISSIIIHGKNYRMKSRWMIVFSLINRLYHFIHEKISHKHHHPHLDVPDSYGIKAAFTIGLIHGIGAETPTQVLLFISAADIGGSLFGSILVFSFVLGLFLSNTAIVLVSVLGYTEVHSHPYLRMGLGLVTAFFSLAVGILFLLGKASFLPVILGG